MAAMRQQNHIPGLTVRPDRPLIGIVMVEAGEEVVRYFADEADADAAVAQHAAASRSLAGAWADLDWEATGAAFDRIRRERAPTPPIDAL